MQHVFWFRRDLRTTDHPALLRAAEAAAGGQLLPLYIHVEDAWARTATGARAHLVGSLTALRADLGALTIRTGRPADVLLGLAHEHGPLTVQATAAHTPTGQDRDRAVAAALAAVGSRLETTGSNYAIPPGVVAKPDGTAYRVFTPFSRAWSAHGWEAPYGSPGRIRLLDTGDRALPPAPSPPLRLPMEPGERSARKRWFNFREGALAEYASGRDRADLELTSRLSAALRWGELHPRTLLADLSSQRDQRFRLELCWRDFYADVLFRNPASAHTDLNPAFAGLRHDEGPEADAAFDLWARGRTGFPFIDAGMRQLRAEGWMHNRARMATASFVVKDLHQPWWRGAAEFKRWLIDGDTASNSHGWQWVAGSGTDAAPYFRVFNPIRQGRRADPDGDYVRRHVPELAHVAGGQVHEPWKVPDGLARGYPPPMLDHDHERAEALRRFAEIRPDRGSSTAARRRPQAL